MWRGLKLLLVAILCAAVSAVRKIENKQKYKSDYSIVVDGKGLLKFHEMPSNWIEAKLRCDAEGAVLASPLTEELRNAMSAALTSNKECAVFTGVHATFSRSEFASIEGTSLADIPHTWAEDEPDNYENDENCIVLLHDGTMGDANCKDTFPYFCYKNCGTDPDYSFDNRTGSCYKFHNVPRTWLRAYMNCTAEGANLAIINSETEATVLKELFAKYPPDSIQGSFNSMNDFALVGVRYWHQERDWITNQGQTLQEAGYAKFLGNSYVKTNCGAIHRNALYYDLWCGEAFAFICERKLV